MTASYVLCRSSWLDWEVGKGEEFVSSNSDLITTNKNTSCKEKETAVPRLYVYPNTSDFPIPTSDFANCFTV